MILLGIRKKSDVNKSKRNFLLKLNPNFDDKVEELSCFGKKVFVCRIFLLKTWGTSWHRGRIRVNYLADMGSNLLTAGKKIFL